RPGVYREAFTLTASGEPGRPIRIEGERGARGALPVVTGNDPFPRGAWRPWPRSRGVWRASLFTGLLGTVSVNGTALVERDDPAELAPGEFCFNRGSEEFLERKADPRRPPREHDAQSAHEWRQASSGTDGFLDLAAACGEGARGAVVWASAWIWMEPFVLGAPVDPVAPRPLPGRVETEGEFRAARMNGAGLADQVNPYRVWVNGERLPAYVRSERARMEVDRPHPGRNYGFSDEWMNFPLHEGWNHLLFQFDTTVRPAKTRFKLKVPTLSYQRRDGSWYDEARPVGSSASPPDDLRRPPAGPRRPWIAEWLVLGPFPSRPDGGVYVRLSGNASPAGAGLDLAARANALATLAGDFIELRGLEFRDGAQFQQRAQVRVTGRGCVVEGCLARDSEVRGITVEFDGRHDQTEPPTMIRGNWIVNPGDVGIGCAGTSEFLTPENLDGAAPGRGRAVIERNVVVNANWAGFDPFWESGGMKLLMTTGCVVRHNTIVGGSGPGLWFDWEHFNDRVEGNLFRDGWAFGVGVEASPGPLLLANNLAVDLRPGAVWFRFGLLEWSSDRVYFMHNTIDGRWNTLPAWQELDGAEGIYVGEGPDDRQTRWGALTARAHAVL
ncbi:MAG: right-handed parallel beta-helix repeat-containing protein, partial [bacterium]